MNMINLEIIAEGLIAMTYLSHIFKKGVLDFVILATLYLTVAMTYQANVQEELKNKNIQYSDLTIFPNDPDIIHMENMLSMLYAGCFIIYVKHCFMHMNIDYLFLFIMLVLIIIVKYNIMSNKGMSSLSNIQMLNIGSLGAVSFIIGKHAFIHDSIDYTWLAGLYSIYSLSMTKI